MTRAEEFFIALTPEIPDVKPGKMFGALCMKTSNGKSSDMFWKDNIVVKLKGSSLHEAMDLTGTELFEPMEGKPMKDWVQIPFAHKDQWKKFALLSADGVRKSATKTSRGKK